MRWFLCKILLVIPFGRSPPQADAATQPIPLPPIDGVAGRRRPRILSLASATRAYARRVEADLLASARPTDLEPLQEAMGPAIWSWQYARRLAGEPPWRARPDHDEGRERALAAREMLFRIEMWERALAQLDRLTERASILGDPAPDQLAVPAEVRDAIAVRQRALLARANRRRGRTEGHGDRDPVPNEGVRHVPPPDAPI